MRTSPYAGRVAALGADDFALLSAAVEARACRNAHGWGTFEEAAEAFRPAPGCPRCGDGRSATGSQRRLCRACGARYGSLAGTVFERSKADFPTWVRLVSMMCWNCQLDAAAELCGISHRTAFE